MASKQRQPKIWGCILGAALLPMTCPAMEFPGPPPGRAAAIVKPEQCRLENSVIGVSWHISNGRLRPGDIIDRLTGRGISAGTEVFSIVLGDGRVVRASDLKLLKTPRAEDLSARRGALRLADRCPGKRLVATLANDDDTLQVDWQAMLRDGDNYVRQELVLRTPAKKSLSVTEIAAIELSAEGALTVGEVPGSPVVVGNLFFACENPLADNRAQPGHVRCSVPCKLVLKTRESLPCISVVGVAPADQMRRAFLCYVERQRPRPYQPFLHYNSWYDIAWGGRKFNEQESLAAIESFGRELVEKRGVKMDSFVFDDGWDDNRTLWGFHDGFPHGFTPLKDSAVKYRSALGVWLSPWGGYGDPKDQRLQYGRTQGFEINAGGFSLAGPKYYARFRQICLDMIDKYGVNCFKFDGVGVGNTMPGEAYRTPNDEQLADTEALLRLSAELHQARPGLYISATTGTWPSPFWLWYGDSIWRGGEDCGFSGEGDMRQQWINYRDATTQQNVVRRAPLFPLNSVMNQGITFAQRGIATRMGNDLKDLQDEFRMFFGCGTQLQELYMTPQLMTPEMWDALAEAAKWSRNNADVLVDTHWIGGDAAKGQPYGYASWSARKGILCVRNPSSQPQNLTLKLAEAFELPQGAPQRYALKSPWKADLDTPAQIVTADVEYSIVLQPFEVRILEATPQLTTRQSTH